MYIHPTFAIDEGPGDVGDIHGIYFAGGLQGFGDGAWENVSLILIGLYLNILHKCVGNALSYYQSNRQSNPGT